MKLFIAVMLSITAGFIAPKGGVQGVLGLILGEIAMFIALTSFN